MLPSPCRHYPRIRSGEGPHTQAGFEPDSLPTRSNFLFSQIQPKPPSVREPGRPCSKSKPNRSIQLMPPHASPRLRSHLSATCSVICLQPSATRCILVPTPGCWFLRSSPTRSSSPSPLCCFSLLMSLHPTLALDPLSVGEHVQMPNQKTSSKTCWPLRALPQSGALAPSPVWKMMMKTRKNPRVSRRHPLPGLSLQTARTKFYGRSPVHTWP